MKMYRQGDVLIVESERDLRYAKVETDNVLVYGEMTGHAHRAEGENVTVLATSRGKVIDARKAFRVVHEEHETIEIPEGFYRVVRQREYDEKAIRYVTLSIRAPMVLALAATTTRQWNRRH